MKHTAVLAIALAAVLSTACKKKDEGKKADPTAAKPGDKPADKPADKPVDPPPPPPAADKEVDLSVWGAPFAGFVAMAPEGTKVTFDDPSRQLAISEEDFLSVSEAPYYADGVKGLASDKDNSNIQIVSDTEARWERNPPLGKQWNFDIKIDVGGAAYSCNGGSFTSAAVADKLVAICKSMKKK